MSRSVVRAQSARAGSQIGAILEHAETVLWYRDHLAPERPHQIAVDSRRARHKLGWIDHVRSTDRMHVQSRARQHAEQGPRAACVIEMYVCNDDPFDVGWIEARLTYACQQGFECAGWPGLDERQRIMIGDEIGCDDARRAAEVMVEQEYTWLDLARETVESGRMVN